jgi:uncharacterized protein
MINPLLDLPRDAVSELCRRYQVKELAVFGSATRDDFRPESDVDFLVEFRPGTRISLLSLLRLQDELASLIGRKVDLVPKEGLKRLSRREVLESCEVVYAA